MASWDPDTYALYRRYRERPAFDLLTAIPRDLDPGDIWDLGCGLGEQAALLAARHPQARVRGLDSSPEMVERAQDPLDPGRVDPGRYQELRAGCADGPDLQQRGLAVGG
jgi:trans-aconitate 2-methyltransferase